MKQLIFRAILLLAGLVPFSLYAQETEREREDRYTRRLQRYERFWQKMTPRYTKVQFAGSMGLLSFGTGWNYGRDHWETDVLLGFVPKYTTGHAKVTLTLKQNYIPWHIPLNEKFTIEPLTCGYYLNTVFGGEFWVRQSDKYPSGYYWFSTRIRNHIFLGERITLKLTPSKSWHKSITFFYELSTCDLYLINAIGNGYLKPKDWLSLSFGLKLQIL